MEKKKKKGWSMGGDTETLSPIRRYDICNYSSSTISLRAMCFSAKISKNTLMCSSAERMEVQTLFYLPYKKIYAYPPFFPGCSPRSEPHSPGGMLFTL